MKKIFSTLSYIAKLRADAARRTSAALSAQISEFEAREKSLRTESAKFGTIGHSTFTEFNEGFRERAITARVNKLQDAALTAESRLDSELNKHEVDKIIWKQEKRVEALKLIRATLSGQGSRGEEVE